MPKRIENIVYPGRFQPFTLGHLCVARSMIDKYPLSKLVIAVPDNRNRSQENPFLGDEVEMIARLAVKCAGLSHSVGIVRVDLDVGLEKAWIMALGNNQVDRVVTGNDLMAELIRRICPSMNIEKLDDDEARGIRATEVRERLTRRENCWSSMVVPGTEDLILSFPIDWGNLPEARKRSWF